MPFMFYVKYFELATDKQMFSKMPNFNFRRHCTKCFTCKISTMPPFAIVSYIFYPKYAVRLHPPHTEGFQYNDIKQAISEQCTETNIEKKRIEKLHLVKSLIKIMKL